MTEDVSPSLGGRGTVDLSECALEPIRTPGAIQPRGALVAVGEGDRRVTHASVNLPLYLGHPLGEVLRARLSDLGSEHLMSAAVAVVADDSAGRPARIGLDTPDGRRVVDLFAHRRDGRIIIELEDVDPGELTATFGAFQDEVRLTLRRLQEATDVQSLLDLAVSVTRQVTGFDRVLAYRFEPDEHGVVLSESRDERLAPLLGLHYPASDIPSQARALYREQWLRAIPDSSATAVDLAALGGEDTPASLDLGGAVLRAVSPVHLEYLRNMGVRASLSVSLIVDRRLWGLIVCHHYSDARAVPYRVRAACEVVGLTASLALESREQLERSEQRLARERTVSALLARVAAGASVPAGLVGDGELLLGVCGASGAALQIENALYLIGRTPPAAVVERIIAAVGPGLTRGAVFETDALAVEHPQLADAAADAAGVLAMGLSHERGNMLLWFRPEQAATVNWAGDPRKAAEPAPSGALRLGPRRSFETWVLNVSGRCEPWGHAEVQAVSSLGSALGGFILERAEQLARLNAELARTNAELGAFTATAVATLSEPLAAISSVAESLIADYLDLLDEHGLARAHSILGLSERMGSLLDSLLAYSRAGRAGLERRAVDFRPLVAESVALLGDALEHAEVTVLGNGKLHGDPEQLRDLLANLLANAARYTERAAPRIEVMLGSASEPGDTPGDVRSGPDAAESVVTVRDDGIGIAQHHLDDIFDAFHRLHGRYEYGGGTGVGLTIARRIVERHGGAIWIESSPGHGTSVRFTLPAG